MSSAPPGLILLLGALLVPFLRGRLLRFTLLVLPVLSAFLLNHTPEGTHFAFELMGYEQARDYVGSWRAWTAADQPVATGR